MRAEPAGSAFTLLEMLVAMTLMSIMAASLYGSLRIGFTARERAESKIAPVRRAQLALELLRGDLEAALPPVGILAAEFLGVDGLDEEGRHADTLLLHTSAHVPAPGQPECDIRRVELGLASVEDESHPALVRFITTQLLAPETPEPAEQVLCRQVHGFNLRYYDGAEWLDAWDSTVQGDTLPYAVEVTLVLVPPEEQNGSGQPGEDVPAEYHFSRVFLLPAGGAGSAGDSVIIRR